MLMPILSKLPTRTRVLGLLLVLACRPEQAAAPITEPPRPGSPATVAIVAGPARDDTTLADPVRAVVVEVRDAKGVLVPGAIVRFEARPATDTTRRDEPTLYVCPLIARTCGSVRGDGGSATVDTTGPTGQAVATVRLGSVAGPTRLVVSLPVFGLRDSTSYLVRPASAATVRFAVRDTAVHEGAMVALRPIVRDRYGNVRADSVIVSGSDPAVAEVARDGLVAGRQIGRVRALVRAGALVDSASVMVVPAGRLVGWYANGDAGGGVVTVDMDGSGLRRMAPAGSDLGVFAHWSPDGARIAFQSGAPVGIVVDSLGNGLHSVGIGRGDYVLAPTFTPNGDVQYVSWSESGQRVWREHADGSGARPLHTIDEPLDRGPFAAMDFSPDGSRIVYQTYFRGFVVADLTTGATRALGIVGGSPRWSPDGRTIAYLALQGGGIGLVNVDSGDRRVLNAVLLSPGITWSPDGRWILGRSSDYGGGMQLTRVSDGAVFSYRIGVDLFQPSWR